MQFIIKPGKTPSLSIKEIFHFRELFYFFVWRDVKVRYKQTLLGTAWAVFRPVISTIIFTFIFNRLAGFDSSGIPYTLFVLSGVIIWNFISEGISSSTQSLITNSSLVSKIYFPRIILPISSVLKGFVDLGVAIVIFIILSIYYQFIPKITLLLFPVAIFWGFIATASIGTLFSAFSVKYRDIAQILPFFIQLMAWISPVGYSADKIPAKYAYIYWLNPIAGVIELSRYSLTGNGFLPINLLAVSIFITLLIIFISLIYFKKLENQFADLI
jgi:lipopolysaccharide transport system permease protein